VACTVINYILICQEIFYAIPEVLKLLWFVSEDFFCLDCSSLEMADEAGRYAKGNKLDELRRGVLG
jgi:hypothetical protein